MQAQAKLIKAVDRVDNRAMLAPRPDDERQFWVEFRLGLLQQLSAIEKRWGLSRRCKNCGELTS